MKTLLWALLFMSSAAHAESLLSDIEQSDLLQSIDNICGDSWCEGDSNWSFDAIQCDSDQACTLKLTMKPYDFNDDQFLEPRPFVCNLDGFHTKSKIFLFGRHGLQYTPQLYEAISNCINDISMRFGPIYVPIANRCKSLFNANAALTPLYVSQEMDSHGLYGAIDAISHLITDRSAIESSCQLVREPYYRDSAWCENTTEATEVCYLPNVDGSFRISRTAYDKTAVSYVPNQARAVELFHRPVASQ